MGNSGFTFDPFGAYTQGQQLRQQDLVIQQQREYQQAELALRQAQQKASQAQWDRIYNEEQQKLKIAAINDVLDDFNSKIVSDPVTGQSFFHHVSPEMIGNKILSYEQAGIPMDGPKALLAARILHQGMATVTALPGQTIGDVGNIPGPPGPPGFPSDEFTPISGGVRHTFTAQEAASLGRPELAGTSVAESPKESLQALRGLQAQTAADLRQQKAIAAENDRQQKQFNQQLALKKVSEDASARKQTAGIYDLAVAGSDRAQTMRESAAHPTPQDDINLLYNHIGMTLSLQKGARINNAEIDRAIKARSVGGGLDAMWEKVSSGQFLTPSQRQTMVNLANRREVQLWKDASDKARIQGLPEFLNRAQYGSAGASPAQSSSQSLIDKLGIK